MRIHYDSRRCGHGEIPPDMQRLRLPLLPQRPYGLRDRKPNEHGCDKRSLPAREMRGLPASMGIPSRKKIRIEAHPEQ